MIIKIFGAVLAAVILALSTLGVFAQKSQKACFGPEVQAEAKRSAKIWMMPDPSYDPVTGNISGVATRAGAPPVGENGLTLPITCKANPDPSPGKGTTPKFYCSVDGVAESDGDLIRYKIKPHFKGQSREKRNGEVYGEFLSSRFSKAVGFFADAEWVADVTCTDCEKSLTSKFQGAPFNPFQPAAGIELSLGKGIDVNCDKNDAAPINRALESLIAGGTPFVEIDAFKLWLAFIDHGDTKTDNQKYACLDTVKNANGSLSCAPGKAVYYVSDMGSTFGHSTGSESKARLAKWASREAPIKVNGGRCQTTAKNVGDPQIGEEGRALLAIQLQKLVDAEQADQTITRTFRASRNAERDEPAEAWAREFIRKANTIINARCGK